MQHSLDILMLAVSDVGRLLLWLVIAFVGLALRRLPGKAICQMCLAMLLAFLINDLALKPLVHSPRPFERDAHVRLVGKPPKDSSFPSGHAAAAFSAATALSRAWPAGTVIWLVLAALISYTRIYLGVHYPIDVLGGALVGVACAWFAVGRTRWLPPARSQRSELHP